MNQGTNNCQTLFVSGLKSDVNTETIRRHFASCIKVTLKQYRTTSQLKYVIHGLFIASLNQYLLSRYAFVFHRTSREARRNLLRPIDRYMFGSECRVEYARFRSAPTNVQESIDQNKVRVGQIPKNVSKNDLRRLFDNCHVVEYCPARTVHLSITTTEGKNTEQTLPG